LHEVQLLARWCWQHEKETLRQGRFLAQCCSEEGFAPFHPSRAVSKGKIMNPINMDRGKYKNELVSDVPVDYLAWAARKMSKTPDYIIAELRDRAAKQGTRDALDAASALSDYEYRTTKNRKKKRKKSNWPTAGKKPAKRRRRKYRYTKEFMPPRKRG
jgi:hypothetical protein